MEIIPSNNVTNGSGYSSIDPITENIPNELKQYNHWVCWKIGVSNDKPTKIPVNPNNGYNAKANDPSTWGTFDQAWSYYCFNKIYGIRGIGYVFGSDDPFVGIDFDKCRNPQTGETESWALNNIGYLNSYAELSPSGTGFHMFIKGTLPPGRNRKDRVEMYESNRFFTMTGYQVEGIPTTIEPRQKQLEEFRNVVFGQQQTKKEPVTQVTVNTQPLNLSDEELIRRAQASQNGDKFSRLLAGDHSGYPSQSEADLALCSMLAFWTGKDSYQMDRIFRQSGLMRDKWDRVAYGNGKTYGQGVVETAIYGTTEVYSPGHSTGRTPQMDMQVAQGHIQKIIELSQNEPKKIVLEITQNTEYLGSLALVAEQDAAVYENFFQQIKLNKVAKTDIDAIRRVIKGEQGKKKLRVVQPGESQPFTVVKDVLPDAPVNDKLILPNNYKLSHQGLVRLELREDNQGNTVPKMIEIASTPILITARTVSIESQNEAVRLTWLRDGKWKHNIADRGIIATSRTITGLANLGLPVTDSNSKELVEYLAEYEALNIDTLPRARVSYNLGWQSDSTSFLWGNTLIQAGGVPGQGINLNDMSPENWTGDMILFRPSDGGNKQVADAFYSRGSYLDWCGGVNSLHPYPRVLAGVEFSLAAPFLEILGAENFVVDWSYQSSKGKTVSLRVAASCWGNPDEKKIPSVLHTWRNSLVWIEKTMGSLRGLPMPLDDTKHAGTGNMKERAGELVSQVLYMVASGQDKGRGSVTGTRDKHSFQTILLTNGEQPAVSFTKDGGSRARVITLWGIPFGNDDPATGAFVKNINRVVKQNFGFAGPRVVQFILDHRREWSLWRQTYLELQDEFSQKAGGNSVADRISGYFAFLKTVMPLIHKALPELKEPPKDILDQLWDSVVYGAEEADQAGKALQVAYNWAASNQTKFYGRHLENEDKTDREPLNGWLGVWKKDKLNQIAFQTEKLKEMLNREGFTDVEAIVLTWKDRGWLNLNKDQKPIKQVRSDKKSNHLYCYAVNQKGFRDIGVGIEEGGQLVQEFYGQLQMIVEKSVPKDMQESDYQRLLNELTRVVQNFKALPEASEFDRLLEQHTKQFNPFVAAK